MAYNYFVNSDGGSKISGLSALNAITRFGNDSWLDPVGSTANMTYTDDNNSHLNS